MDSSHQFLHCAIDAGVQRFSITSFLVRCEIFQRFRVVYVSDIVPDPELTLFGCSESLLAGIIGLQYDRH